jgi:hypothetical protein
VFSHTKYNRGRLNDLNAAAIHMSMLIGINPAVDPASLTPEERADMQADADFRCSLHDSTFSRTAWRLYGGAKGLVMRY